jgi:hypothetical protein
LIAVGMMTGKGACQIRRAPGQVVLKGPRSPAKDPQVATNMALESKPEILSQVVPTSQKITL